MTGVPGVFFNYEISPILVVHTETRQSFAHFITSYVSGLLFPPYHILTCFLEHAPSSEECSPSPPSLIVHSLLPVVLWKRVDMAIRRRSMVVMEMESSCKIFSFGIPDWISFSLFYIFNRTGCIKLWAENTIYIGGFWWLNNRVMYAQRARHTVN